MKKILFYVLAPGLLLVLSFIYYAPVFLLYSDFLHKAEAIVLFIGPDQQARLDEAMTLLRNRYAHYLIIPAYGEIRMVADAGLLETFPLDSELRSKIFATRKSLHYHRFYENTHVEVLEAKRILDKLGFRSAILVSSAYHMQRIKLIAGRVFDGQKYSISCTPARWQKTSTVADWLDLERWKIIVSEYVKIGWFLVYGVFS